MGLGKTNMLNSFYQLWLWIGIKMDFIRKYNKQRDMALDRARKSLEEAFTPQLQKILDEDI